MQNRPKNRAAEGTVRGPGYGRNLPTMGLVNATVSDRRPSGSVSGLVKATERDTRGGRPMVVLRREIGDVLRDARQRQGRTLREVSSAARVSLGYLSEVERGQKEASSELLGSICGALDVPLSHVLREVSDRVAIAEGILIPDTIPVELAASLRGPSTGGLGRARGRGELARVG